MGDNLFIEHVSYLFKVHSLCVFIVLQLWNKRKWTVLPWFAHSQCTIPSTNNNIPATRTELREPSDAWYHEATVYVEYHQSWILVGASPINQKCYLRINKKKVVYNHLLILFDGYYHPPRWISWTKDRFQQPMRRMNVSASVRRMWRVDRCTGSRMFLPPQKSPMRYRFVPEAWDILRWYWILVPLCLWYLECRFYTSLETTQCSRILWNSAIWRCCLIGDDKGLTPPYTSRERVDQPCY